MNLFLSWGGGGMVWVGACLDASVDESSGGFVEGSEPLRIEQRDGHCS